MSRSEHKHQKKIAKRNKRASQVRKQLIKNRNLSGLDYLLTSARYPIEKVWRMTNDGLDSIVIARSLPSGAFLVAGFLVDRYCLGVGDTFLKPNVSMEWIRDRTAGEDCEQISPSYALKIILGAMEYAQSLGFPPAQDLQTKLRIFDGVDPSESKETVEFGRNGRPMFIQTPRISDAYAKVIIDTLSSHVGEGNFDYLMGSSPEEIWDVEETMMEGDESDFHSCELDELLDRNQIAIDPPQELLAPRIETTIDRS